MRLIAKQPLRYANRSIAIDESFEATVEMDARLLVASGRAVWADGPPMPTKRRGRYRRRDLRPVD